MEAVKSHQSGVKSIYGRNFHGNIQIKGSTLQLEVAEFGKGGIYAIELTNMNLQKQFKRFLIFKKIDDLYEELISNPKIQMSDQNTLIIPLDVSYKNKSFQLRIEVPLLQRKFNNEEEKMQTLMRTIQKMNKYINKLRGKEQVNQQLPQPIHFKGDTSNQNYNKFQVSPNGKTIKMLGNNQWACFNHQSSLINKGIFYFKFKIAKSISKYMFVGVCSKELRNKSGADLYNNPLFMGIYLFNGYLYANGKNSAAASGYKVVEGESIFKVEISMDKSIITWLHNDVKLYSTEISKQLVNAGICPMVSLYSSGDSIEFIDR